MDHLVPPRKAWPVACFPPLSTRGVTEIEHTVLSFAGSRLAEHMDFCTVADDSMTPGEQSCGSNARTRRLHAGYPSVFVARQATTLDSS